LPAITYRRIVHLSHVLEPGIPCWPGDPPVRRSTAALLARDGYNLQQWSLGEHSGTHLNAPRAFWDGAAAMDGFPAAGCVAPAAVIDVAAQAEANRDYGLSVADIGDWESRWGPIERGTIVLLRSGWDRRWQDPADYLGIDEHGRPHFPGFGADAAALLVGQRRVTGLGTDTAGVEPGSDSLYSVNRLALGESLVVLENLTGLEELPPLGATIAIGALRLRGGSGSPAAVLGLV
jgi:kynurenine formamidase